MDQIVAENTLGDVVLLDVETLRENLRLPGSTDGEGSGVRFSPCGRFVIDRSWRGNLLVGDAASGEVVLHEPGDPIGSIDCTADL
jgi:hypothetical protein